MPERSKKILFVSNCILNQNTIASGLVKKGYTSAVWDLIKLCEKHNIGMEQLPCPEFQHRGYPREPDTKPGYNTKEFREICSEYSSEIKEKIDKFKKAGFECLGIVGIAGSPSCGIHETHLVKERRDKGMGIFMEELKKRIDIPMVDFDYRDVENSLKRIEELLK